MPIALAATHDAAGHHGATATTFQMQTRFSFPRLVTRTRNYVIACAVCGRMKRDLRPVPLGRIPIFGFLDAVGVDFAGPFPESASGNKYLAILTCHSTKWLHVSPTPSCGVNDSAMALLSFVQHAGIPGSIKHDKCAAFVAKIWCRLMHLLGIADKPTVAYNPQGDSHAECAVGNTKSIVKAVVQRHPRHWDDAARWAAWSYNASYNSTIGTTPYFARHGREPRYLGDVIFSNPAASDSVTLSQLIARIRDVHRVVQDRVSRMHDKFIAANANLRRTRTFEVGDAVWLHRVYPGRTARAAEGLARAWFWPFRPEPYEVIARCSDQHVKIMRSATPDRPAGKPQVVHVRRLKPYRPQVDAFNFSDLAIAPDIHGTP